MPESRHGKRRCCIILCAVFGRCFQYLAIRHMSWFDVAERSDPDFRGPMECASARRVF